VGCDTTGNGQSLSAIRTSQMQQLLILLTASVVLLDAAPALAGSGSDDGQGTYGHVSDKVETNFAFALIGGIPLLILVLSLLQRALKERKQRRLAVEKARRTSAAAGDGRPDAFSLVAADGRTSAALPPATQAPHGP
jgi:hypothetical protein